MIVNSFPALFCKFYEGNGFFQFIGFSYRQKFVFFKLGNMAGKVAFSKPGKI